MILAAVLSIALAVIGNAGTVIVFFKPDQLRLRELPVLLWVRLAGERESGRLRAILARRQEAAQAMRLAAVRAMTEADFQRRQRVALLADVPASGPPMTSLPPPPTKPPAGPPPRPREGRIWQVSAGRMERDLLASRPRVQPGAFGTLITEIRRKCPDHHQVLWVEGQGRVCRTCEQQRGRSR